jgi:hypothetical protein
MNTPKAAGLLAVPHKAHGAKPSPDAVPTPQSGWDPYEVWRTRVLQPRLEPRAAEARADASPKPFLVRST